MRTYVLTVTELPKHGAALVKKPVQPNDRVLFQTLTEELEVRADEVITEPGLMKGWALIAWKQKEVSNG